MRAIGARRGDDELSDSDSFFREVSEDLLRDRLSGHLRRYGWIGILAILLIVGGAAWLELQKSAIRATSESRGDVILAALEAEEGDARRDALSALKIEGGACALPGLLTANNAVEAEDAEGAADALAVIEGDSCSPQLYRDLATLKRVTLSGESMAPSERIAAMQPLLEPGGAFRTLAEEQVALAEIELGERGAARARLQRLVDDAETTSGLRRRASRLIMALGEADDPA